MKKKGISGNRYISKTKEYSVDYATTLKEDLHVSTQFKINEVSDNKIKNSFDFLLFYKEYSKRYSGKEPPDSLFLEWLLGFSEGKAEFRLVKKGDLSFVITLPNYDVKVLIFIKERLGFGSVTVDSPKKKNHQYIVQDFDDICLLTLLFNGNMVLITRKARFDCFLSFINERLVKKNMKVINISTNRVSPFLENNWFAGLNETKGLFKSSISSDNSKYKIEYTLQVKWEVDKDIFLDLLRANNGESLAELVYEPETKGWKFYISDVENCLYLLHYFDKYSIKTKKQLQYEKWKDLLIRLNSGEHLDNNKKSLFKSLSKKINSK